MLNKLCLPRLTLEFASQTDFRVIFGGVNLSHRVKLDISATSLTTNTNNYYIPQSSFADAAVQIIAARNHHANDQDKRLVAELRGAGRCFSCHVNL